MNKVVMILVPLALIGGVVGAAMSGVISIPGLSQEKKKPPLPYGEGSGQVAQTTPEKKVNPSANAAPPDKPVPPKETKSQQAAAAPKPSDAPKPDWDRGAKKIAKLWNSIQTDKLLPMVDQWKDPELARVLAFMDVEKAASLLSQMKPERASKLSLAIQVEASAPKSSP